MADIPIFVTSEQVSTERRISPSWTISLLKAKLEPVTGIPPSSQKLRIHGTGTQSQVVDDSDEDAILVSTLNLAPYGRLHVEDTRPVSQQINIVDTSGVEKYVMSDKEYSSREDSVLAWKKTNQLGRFDPNAKTLTEQQDHESGETAIERGITAEKRCIVSSADSVSERRGTVKYVGPVPEISKGNTVRVWVGVEFDEPLGKHDGTVQGKHYFTARSLHGSFVKPDLVQVGDYPEEDFDLDDEEL